MTKKIPSYIRSIIVHLPITSSINIHEFQLKIIPFIISPSRGLETGYVCFLCSMRKEYDHCHERKKRHNAASWTCSPGLVGVDGISCSRLFPDGAFHPGSSLTVSSASVRPPMPLPSLVVDS